MATWFVLTGVEFVKICQAVGMGLVLMGFIGYFIKLIHIPINNIIVYARAHDGHLSNWYLGVPLNGGINSDNSLILFTANNAMMSINHRLEAVPKLHQVL